MESRRRFLQAASLAVAGAVVRRLAAQTAEAESSDAIPIPGLPIIDIDQHCRYNGRPDEQLIVHQKNTGIRTTVILPASNPGTGRGEFAGNDVVVAFARSHSDRFRHFTSANAGRSDAVRVMESCLKSGAIGIGVLKDEVACDSPGIIRVAELAREYDVPVLMHFQDLGPKNKIGYNDGYVRFFRILERFPTVKFIGHAQTFWANIDKNYRPEQGLYPKGPVVPGGLTDRWLADYPNFYGDLSAYSGNGGLTRDVEFTRSFLARQQDKLLYGSDCECATGRGPACTAAVKLKFLHRYFPTEAIRDKILFANARKLLRLGST